MPVSDVSDRFCIDREWFRASKWLKSIKFREKSLEFPRRVLFWSESERKIRSRIIKSSGIDWARCVDTPRYQVFFPTPSDGWEPEWKKNIFSFVSQWGNSPLSAEGCSRCNISLAKRHACFVETNACEIDVSRHRFLWLLKKWLHETGFVSQTSRDLRASLWNR